MRKYMKPVLEVSEDMTEGVYLASGNAQDEEKTTCRFVCRLRNHKECEISCIGLGSGRVDF